MSVVILLIGASVLIAIGFLIAFIWSVKTGQYDDDYTPSVRILFEDETTNGYQISELEKTKIKTVEINTKK